MSESETRIAFLRRQFELYTQLPRQHPDADFHSRLRALQRWEKSDLQRRHTERCGNDTDYRSVFDYYVTYVHNGLDLQGMIDKGPDAIENARRLDKAYQLFANGIEHSVTCARLEDQLTEMIGDQPLTAAVYAGALGQCDDAELRRRRLSLVVEIGHEIVPHLNSRLMHTGFRLLKGLFRSHGMGDIHETLDEGFRQLRGVKRVSQALAEIAQTERQHLEQMLAGSPN